MISKLGSWLVRYRIFYMKSMYSTTILKHSTGSRHNKESYSTSCCDFTPEIYGIN